MKNINQKEVISLKPTYPGAIYLEEIRKLELTSISIKNYSGSSGGGLYISLSESFKKFSFTSETFILD